MILDICVSYLCGSIPFGLILSNCFGNGKLRSLGSGNIGATNVVRTQGKILGGLTFLLDGLKGIIPFLLLKSDYPTVIFAAVVLGHMFPIWLRFKGGKGISTFFGAMLAVNPVVSIISMFIWLCTFLLSEISSLSGLVAISIGSLIFIYRNGYTYNTWECIAFLIIPVCIILKHHENIMRLINGEEKAISNNKN